MRRATITLSDEIEASLDAYIQPQKVAPSLSVIMQTALQEFLFRRGFSASVRKLHITPAKKGSGAKDVSVDHDRYLASH
jgi:predicted transcriptional regulator